MVARNPLISGFCPWTWGYTPSAAATSGVAAVAEVPLERRVRRAVVVFVFAYRVRCG